MLPVVADTFSAQLEALALRCTLLVTEHRQLGEMGWWLLQESKFLWF